MKLLRINLFTCFFLMGAQRAGTRAVFSKSRIKQILFNDEEVGKISATVAVIISRATELFLEDLMKEVIQSPNNDPSELAQSTNLVVTTSTLKNTIYRESRFDFLKDQISKYKDDDVELTSTLKRAAKSTKSLDTCSNDASDSNKTPKKRVRKNSKKIAAEKEGNHDEAEKDVEAEEDRMTDATDSSKPSLKKQKVEENSILSTLNASSTPPPSQAEVAPDISPHSRIKVEDLVNSTSSHPLTSTTPSPIIKINPATPPPILPTINVEHKSSPLISIPAINKLTSVDDDDDEFD